MLILALDTSGKTASCAIARDGVLLAEKKQTSELSHSRTLLPMCEEMLAENGLTLSDFDLFAATAGPGSFTGLRIGIAAVKGFAFVKNTPCAGVSTMESAAYGAKIEDGVICAAVRARPEEYYCAFFRAEKGRITRLTEDAVMQSEEIRKKAGELGSKIALCGEGSAGLLPCGAFEDTGKTQSAAGTAAAAVFCEKISCHSLMPSYLKPSQAERMKKERENI